LLFVLLKACKTNYMPDITSSVLIMKLALIRWVAGACHTNHPTHKNPLQRFLRTNFEREPQSSCPIPRTNRQLFPRIDTENHLFRLSIEKGETNSPFSWRSFSWHITCAK